MNVPGLTATSVEAIPSETPYILPDPDLVAHWKRELAGTPGLEVGINWQGNPKYSGDRRRSIPLEFFEPLSRVPRVRLFSLQKNAGLDQLDALACRVGRTMLRVVRPTEGPGRCGGPRLDKSNLDPPYSFLPATFTPLPMIRLWSYVQL
jgi:hypothetical protein